MAVAYTPGLKVTNRVRHQAKRLLPIAGDVKTVLKQATLLMARASPSVEAHAQLTPQVDWWPDFARAVLGKESRSRPVPVHAAESLASG